MEQKHKYFVAGALAMWLYYYWRAVKNPCESRGKCT